MDYGPIEAFLVGIIGKTEKEAALTTMHEYELLLDGYEKKQRTAWEVARWEQFQQVLISPNIKPFNKPHAPHDFCPFPWDKDPAPVTTEDIRVTDEETALFQLVIEDMKRRRNELN